MPGYRKNVFAESDLQQHRTELRAHCYRMLGSINDAEDAVQDAMVRAWVARDRYEDRGGLRAWLYRIATNVCLDSLKSAKRRFAPSENAAAMGDTANLAQYPSEHWVEPAADALVIGQATNPAQALLNRQHVAFALIVALQKLSPKERAVLLLRDVLGFSANETATTLETSVAASNSALQRARTALAADHADLQDKSREDDLDEAHAELLVKYMDAFAAYDLERLVALLRDDVEFCMPPYELWFQGPTLVQDWMREHDECRGSQLQQVFANGRPAFAQYRPHPTTAGYQAWALVTIETDGKKVSSVRNFLDVETLFPQFGLPLNLDATPARSAE